MAIVHANQSDVMNEPEKFIQYLSKTLLDDAYIGNSEHLLGLINKCAIKYIIVLMISA